MQWVIRDKVDLNGRAVVREYGALMVPGDSGAQVWRVALYDGDMTVDLTGQTVQAFFDRPDGETVVVTGSVAGNIAAVEIPRDVCLVAGCVRGLMCLGDRVNVQDAFAAALVIGYFTVEPGPGSVLVTPSTEFADITTLSGRVDDADAANAANAGEITRVEGKVDDLADVVASDGWHALAAARGVNEGISNMGIHTGSAISYRVENGHHVYIHMNVAFTYTPNSMKQLTSAALPPELIPGSRAVAFGVVSGSANVGRFFLSNTDGLIYVERAYNLSTGRELEAKPPITWTDAYIEYFIQTEE